MKNQVRSHEERVMRYRGTLSSNSYRHHDKRAQPACVIHSSILAQARAFTSLHHVTRHAKKRLHCNQWNTAEGDMKTSTTFFVPIFLMVVTSCGPTTDTVVAPFELTSDFTSSTSPGNSALTDPAKARQRLERFVAYAYDSVGCDIAQGHGEYLHSLAVLAGVPTDAQAAFQAEMQGRYAAIYDLGLSRKETTTLIVTQAWSAGYGRAENWHNSPKANGS
jgi:hypothetical protein